MCDNSQATETRTGTVTSVEFGVPLDRRRFLTALPACAACLAGGGLGVFEWRRREPQTLDELASRSIAEPLRDEGATGRIAPHPGDSDQRLLKIKEFDRAYSDDFFLTPEQLATLRSAAARVDRALHLVGHGNFNLLSFDALIRFAQNYSEIGAFPKVETDFLEELFYADAARYGFFGQKVITDLTERIPDREVTKVAGSGHYLLKGDSLTRFQQIRRDIGDSIALTSGVRSVGKQFQLFLTKAVETEGNLSQASRSLAPPGYSFHARGDFDIGKAGFGLRNFTESFGETQEFQKLIDLGYVSIRYTETNPFGVRHEPWHIKIA